MASTTVFQFRIDEAELERFRTLCEGTYKLDHRDVVRELISAYADGRITITPDDAMRERSKLYAGE